MFIEMKTFYRLESAIQFIKQSENQILRLVAEDVGGGRKKYFVAPLRVLYRYCCVVGNPKLYEVTSN